MEGWRGGGWGGERGSAGGNRRAHLGKKGEWQREEDRKSRRKGRKQRETWERGRGKTETVKGGKCHKAALWEREVFPRQFCPNQSGGGGTEIHTTCMATWMRAATERNTHMQPHRGFLVFREGGGPLMDHCFICPLSDTIGSLRQPGLNFSRRTGPHDRYKG